jgi:hypothetical protein
MYGGLLGPEARQAMAARGLLAAAGAFGQAAMLIEKALPHLFPSPDPVGQSRRRFIVPYTSQGIARPLHGSTP